MALATISTLSSLESGDAICGGEHRAARDAKWFRVSRSPRQEILLLNAVERQHLPFVYILFTDEHDISLIGLLSIDLYLPFPP